MLISDVKGYHDVMADMKAKGRTDIIKKLEDFDLGQAEKRKWKRSIPKGATVILVRRVYEDKVPEYQLLTAEYARWFKAWICFDFQVIA